MIANFNKVQSQMRIIAHLKFLLMDLHPRFVHKTYDFFFLPFKRLPGFRECMFWRLERITCTRRFVKLIRDRYFDPKIAWAPLLSQRPTAINEERLRSQPGFSRTSEIVKIKSRFMWQWSVSPGLCLLEGFAKHEIGLRHGRAWRR